MLCSPTAQYIRERYTWCLQYLTMTHYATNDSLVFYLALIKTFSWVAKYGYLQQHFLCISTLTGHMAENLQKYLSLPLNILQYVQIPGETNGYSEFCLLYLTIYQNKNQRHFCQTQYGNLLI